MIYCDSAIAPKGGMGRGDRPEFPSDRIVDRIGPAGSKIGELIPDVQFGYPGLRHDIRYYIGGTERERSIADSIFRQDMLSLSTDLEDTIRAEIYYWFVKRYGKRYFEYK